MKHLFPQLSMVTLTIVFLGGFMRMFYTYCIYESMTDHQEGNDTILMVCPHHTPQPGDVVWFSLYNQGCQPISKGARGTGFRGVPYRCAFRVCS